MTVAGKADSASPALVLFRDDLRLEDNPALLAAAQSGRPVMCVFTMPPHDGAQRLPGGAARWWLHGGLERLAKALAEKGSSLHFCPNATVETLLSLAGAVNAASVHWNRRYGKAEREADAELKAALRARGVEAQSHNAHLLYEPWEVTTANGAPMRVYSPFWRAALKKGEPAPPRTAPASITPYRGGVPLPHTVALEALNLHPTKPDWSGTLNAAWHRGESAARAQLTRFLEQGIAGYDVNRNRPDFVSTSRLSPYLRHGEISVRQVWHAAKAAEARGVPGASATDFETFYKELGWREFSYHLLFHNPDLATRNHQPKFDQFPWLTNDAHLTAWQRGRTGYPIVDAGMRELYQTGWMHNRVRMIVASFLVKHLLIHWRSGEEWFWDTLVDADPASNAASWQWVAGSGADAAPYFRIFNPITQGEKFDPDGGYIRRFVPELGRLNKDVIHMPWAAPVATLHSAGVKLGTNYAFPIVDHAMARARALEALKSTALPRA
jgi:deoxyribodipyrimidine photo-lyase